jgi:hypothetical protein
MIAFWDLACSLAEVHRRFRGAYYFHHQADRHVVSFKYIDVSEVYFNKTILPISQRAVIFKIATMRT